MIHEKCGGRLTKIITINFLDRFKWGKYYCGLCNKNVNKKDVLDFDNSRHEN